MSTSGHSSTRQLVVTSSQVAIRSPKDYSEHVRESSFGQWRMFWTCSRVVIRQAANVRNIFVITIRPPDESFRYISVSENENTSDACS